MLWLPHSFVEESDRIYNHTFYGEGETNYTKKRLDRDEHIR